MANRDEVVQQALALPPGDRADVVGVLEQSLVKGDFASLEIAAAWMEDTERRASAYERGEMQAAQVPVGHGAPCLTYLLRGKGIKDFQTARTARSGPYSVDRRGFDEYPRLWINRSNG